MVCFVAVWVEKGHCFSMWRDKSNGSAYGREKDKLMVSFNRPLR